MNDVQIDFISKNSCSSAVAFQEWKHKAMFEVEGAVGFFQMMVA